MRSLSFYELGYEDGYYGYYSDPQFDWSWEYWEGYNDGEEDYLDGFSPDSWRSE